MKKDITHLGDLRPDDQNARKHNERNISVIVDSLHEIGGARSIVIDEDGKVLAGNGVVEAAGIAGIERVTVVDADGSEIIAVRRQGLSEEQKQRLALFDNRTSDLSEFDPEILQKMDRDLFKGMWGEKELNYMFDNVENIVGTGEVYKERYEIVVECDNEEHQRETFERLSGDGYKCRVLTL